jgi:DNA-binding NarL/FixJ family response regulator
VARELYPNHGELSYVSVCGEVSRVSGLDFYKLLSVLHLTDEGAAEMLRELNEANPPVAVLVLRRTEEEGVREEFLAAGASEVLSQEISFASRS